MKKSKINTLAELKQERRRLSLMKEVTKREISHSIGLMQSETKDFTLNKLAIPLGITAITGILVNKTMTSNEKPKQGSGNSIINTIIALLPLAMKLLNNQHKE